MCVCVCMLKRLKLLDSFRVPPAHVLTQSPLSLVSHRQVEDVWLVSRVRLVVRLDVDGELFHKGTGVSGGEETEEQVPRPKSTQRDELNTSE